MRLIPNSWGSQPVAYRPRTRRLREYNQCHHPSGHPEGGGRFCSSKQSGGGSNLVPPSKAKAVGEFPEDWETNKAAVTAYYEREEKWEERMRRALTFGIVTPNEARKLGFYAGSFEDPQFGPLPETLYHVTTNVEGVRKSRLKTRGELSQVAGLGLGGGPDDTISFTDDPKIARAIYEGIHEMRKVALGEITIKQMRDEARRGVNAQRPFWDELKGTMSEELWDAFEKGYTQLNYEDEEKLRKEVSSIIGVPESYIKKKGWQILPNHEGWKGRDERMYPTHAIIRKATPEEQRRARVQVYKQFSFWREKAGGPLDPLFFLSDAEGLANTDPSNIAILTVKPRKNAHGWKVSALNEWRTWHGAAVRVLGAERPPRKLRP